MPLLRINFNLKLFYKSTAVAFSGFIILLITQIVCLAALKKINLFIIYRDDKLK